MDVEPVTPLPKPQFQSLSSISRLGGIPVLHTLWNQFDLSLLLSQSGIFKSRGVATWILAFVDVIGLLAGCSSVNALAALYAGDGLRYRLRQVCSTTVEHPLTIHLDIVANRFARLIRDLWPPTLELGWFASRSSKQYLGSTA